MIQRISAIWFLVPLPFLNPACTSGSSRVPYSWSLAWRILSITLLACESEVTQLCTTLCDLMDCSLPGSSIHGIFQARVLEWVAISFSRGSSRPRDRSRVSLVAGQWFTALLSEPPGKVACELSAIVWHFEHCLALPFFRVGMKTNLFQSYGHCWVFQICWHMECSTFTASSLRILNSSAGIPSHLLALFVVMLPKAHLTSCFRMSGSRWVITSSWLTGSWRSFFFLI